MALDFYISNETRKIKGNRLVLPPIFAKTALERAQCPINFALFYEKINGFPYLSLYDNYPLFGDLPFNEKTRAITLPKKAWETLFLHKNIVIIGAYDHIELWKPKTFREYTKTISEEHHQQMKKILNA